MVVIKASGVWLGLIGGRISTCFFAELSGTWAGKRVRVEIGLRRSQTLPAGTLLDIYIGHKVLKNIITFLACRIRTLLLRVMPNPTNLENA